MLKSAQQPTHAVFVLVPALLVFFTVALAQLFAIPPHATSYVSDEDAVTAFVTARPAELGDRCYQETTGTALCATGSTCIDSGRTPWWDTKRGAYHIIEMTALHTRLCTSQCCPAKPPVGTCYKKWLTASCAAGYTKAYSTLLSGSLCCVPGSCYWFQTSLTNCDCPAGYASSDRTDSCMAGGWSLCCPIGADVAAMELSAKPFERAPQRAPPPPSPAVAAIADVASTRTEAPPPPRPSA